MKHPLFTNIIYNQKINEDTTALVVSSYKLFSILKTSMSTRPTSNSFVKLTITSTFSYTYLVYTFNVGIDLPELIRLKRDLAFASG